MKILIEEFEYQDPQILAFLKEVDSTRNKGKVPFVGYMFSKSLKDCVFFLPKVILDEVGKAFKKYDPNVLWNISQEQLSEEERQFLNSFPIWTYQAINIYNCRNPKNIIVRYRKLSNSEVSDASAHVPFLENIIEIIKFAQENKSFLLFKMQHMHSGQGKVNWTKTISSQQPFFKKGKAPVYLNPVVKKKYVDYEEELLVIFFSILRYINSQYGFSANINLNFELIPKERFNDYLNGEGTRRLHEIRYRYFSDRTLRIWRLCYAFFSRNDRINSSIMFITHDLGVIAEMADYVVVMYAGRIVERGTAEEIFAHPAHPYTIGLMASKPIVGKHVETLYSIPGKVPNPVNMPNYCYFKDRCEMCVEGCDGEYPHEIHLSPTHAVTCYRYYDKKEDK